MWNGNTYNGYGYSRSGSYGWAALRGQSDTHGGGIYRMVDGKFVEANYDNGKATWDNQELSASRPTGAGAGGSGGGGPTNFVFNGVWAAQKGGKSMGKKKQTLSGEPLGKEYLDAVKATDEANRKARDTRIKKNSENREKNLRIRREATGTRRDVLAARAQELNARAAENADYRAYLTDRAAYVKARKGEGQDVTHAVAELKREKARYDARVNATNRAIKEHNLKVRRSDSYERGDIAGFAGKSDGKSMKGFLAGRAKLLEQGKAGAAQAIANAEARLRQGQKDYARYSKNVERDREERDSMNHSEAGSYKAYTDYVAAVKAGGGKPSSFRSWQIQDRVAREKERSIKASNNIWNKILAERKIARSQERIAAAQQAQEGYTADIARLHDLGKTLKDYDEASAADVARQLQARDLTGRVEYAGVRPSADVMRESYEAKVAADKAAAESKKPDATAKAALLAGRSSRKGGYRR